MEDKIRNLLWIFLDTVLVDISLFFCFSICMIAFVLENGLLLTIGLGILICMSLLIALSDILENRYFKKRQAERIKKLDEFRERMRDGNHE